MVNGGGAALAGEGGPCPRRMNERLDGDRGGRGVRAAVVVGGTRLRLGPGEARAGREARLELRDGDLTEDAGVDGGVGGRAVAPAVAEGREVAVMDARVVGVLTRRHQYLAGVGAAAREDLPVNLDLRTSGVHLLEPLRGVDLRLGRTLRRGRPLVRGEQRGDRPPLVDAAVAIELVRSLAGRIALEHGSRQGEVGAIEVDLGLQRTTRATWIRTARERHRRARGLVG